MKYSQHIGIVASLAIIGVCFLPWVFIPSLNLTLNGVNGKVNDALTFGTQWKSHSFFAVLMIICFAKPKVWAKRTNMFMGVFNIGWAIKNYILFSMCRPDCPEVKIGLYLLVFFAITMLVMSLLPKLKV